MKEWARIIIGDSRRMIELEVRRRKFN